ncbi:MAG: site-specific integrase [Phycisphaerales bacterium]|nr:site-specific integrase [Phycisphaerales bacterium]
MSRVTKPPRIPSYRLHRPSGQAVVTLSGRDVYLGPHGTDESHAAYEREVAEWLANGRRHSMPDDAEGGMSVNELVLAYWRHVEVYYVKGGAPSSEQCLIRSALRRFRGLYGDMVVGEVTPRELKTVRHLMIEEGLSRPTVNGYVSRIVACFRWGVEECLVPTTVLEGLRAVRGLRRGRSQARETAPIRPVAVEVVEATLPLLPAVVAAMVRVQLFTGMRPGEVCAMTTGELDMRGDVWVYVPREHKNAHHGLGRAIPIGPKARKELAAYVRTDLGAPIFQPDNRRGRRRAGLGYTTQSYGRAIKRVCDEAGLPRWTPNQLRHTRATEVRREFGLDAAGAVLGHAKLETTQVYAERALEVAKDVARRSG